MPSRELSILVAAKGALTAARDIGKVDKSVGKLAAHAKRGAGAAATNLTRIGVLAAGGIAVAVKGGISSLAELEDAVTSVDGAIAQVGKGWTTTGQNIADIANEIETNVQRAFDDKEITQGATALIRYGKVSEANIRPALEVMTDLAARTGSVEAASRTLAKALADPTKAAGALRKAGVILTKDQEKQIATMVKAGKTTEAQAFLLDQLKKSTGGAAAAMHGPYRDALLILADVTEDAQRALGEGFLPVITKVADRLSTALADPKTIEQIRNFGKGLADGFDKALEFGQQIPWGLIGDSLKTAGAGARLVFQMFTAMPPWVQTAVITGWGLNKLTGGALGGIVGELGKGLIKGVLGMNAGVVNLRAGVVNGAGMGAGAAGAAGAGTRGAGALGTLSKVVGVLAIAEIAQEFHDEVTDFGVELHKKLGLPDIGFKPSEIAWPFGSKDAPEWARFDPSGVNRGGQAKSPVLHPQAFDGKHNRTLRVFGEVEDKRGAVNWSKIARETARTPGKIDAVARTMSNQGSRIVAAIHGLDMNIKLVVPVTVRKTSSGYTSTTGNTTVRIGGNAARGAEAGM